MRWANDTPLHTALDQITRDVDDARVYGGIHFRFDQKAGGRLGHDAGAYVYKHNLRAAHGDGRIEHPDEDDARR